MPITPCSGCGRGRRAPAPLPPGARWLGKASVLREAPSPPLSLAARGNSPGLEAPHTALKRAREQPPERAGAGRGEARRGAALPPAGSQVGVRGDGRVRRLAGRHPLSTHPGREPRTAAPAIPCLGCVSASDPCRPSMAWAGAQGPQGFFLTLSRRGCPAVRPALPAERRGKRWPEKGIAHLTLQRQPRGEARVFLRDRWQCCAVSPGSLFPLLPTYRTIV